MVTPDSSHLICLTTPDVYDDPPKRLFSAPVDGSAAPVELNLPRAVDGGVATWQVSPDSTRVVYTGAQAVAERIELFSAPVSGGSAPVQLNGTLAPGANIHGPKISADSSRVAYLADRGSYNSCPELFSVPLAGGSEPVELSALPSVARGIGVFEISPDSTRVVYTADQDVNAVDDIYSVPLAGGPPIVLRPLGSGTSVASFLISPDSRWVVYSVSGVHQSLFSVPLAGGAAPVLLSPPADYPSPVAISADSRTVVFGTRRPDYATDLFSVPIAGGSIPVQLNESLPVTTYGVSIDSSSRCVLYYSAPHEPGRQELFIAPLNGEGPSRSVAGALPAGASGSYGAFRPGTSSVVYTADKEEAGARELYIDEFVTEKPGHHRRR